MDELERAGWPGNVRELQNWVERAVILSPGRVLRMPPEQWALEGERPGPAGWMLAEAERQHILRVLCETNWTVGGRSGAATRLGVPRTTLISRMEKVGIVRPCGSVTAFAPSSSPIGRVAVPDEAHGRPC